MIRISNGVARHPLWRMAEPINLEIKKGEQIAIVGSAIRLLGMPVASC